MISLTSEWKLNEHNLHEMSPFLAYLYFFILLCCKVLGSRGGILSSLFRFNDRLLNNEIITISNENE